MDEPKIGNPEPVQDEEFEPSAEMMVNDFDDERTLDEEEALEEADEQQNELSHLEKEKDMPLEALLAMYGYNDQDGDADAEGEGEGDEDEESRSTSPEEEASGQEEKLEGEEGLQQGTPIEEGESEKNSQIVEEINCDEEDKTTPPPSMLHELYKDDPSVTGGSRQLRSGSRQHSEEEEEEEDDGDYSPEEDDWKKTIMVGSDYQAVIPEGLRKYDDAMPYENEDKMLWDPSCTGVNEIADYLNTVQNIQGVSYYPLINAIPQGSHVRDDEQALYLLLQCGHNAEEAVRRQKINAASAVDTMSLWSEEECRNFETGLRTYGKDFHQIQQNKVRTRSVSELVQFYYLWKKTERHDVFANKSRLEKKKYTLHPGTTDYMERFLDEHESPVSSPNVHSLLSGDPKRQARTPPPVQSQSDVEVITFDEARIINTHFEDIARHLDQESLESLVKLAAAARPSNGMQNSSTNESGSASNNRSCVSACESGTLAHTVSVHSVSQ